MRGRPVSGAPVLESVNKYNSPQSSLRSRDFRRLDPEIVVSSGSVFVLGEKSGTIGHRLAVGN